MPFSRSLASLAAGVLLLSGCGATSEAVDHRRDEDPVPAEPGAPEADESPDCAGDPLDFDGDGVPFRCDPLIRLPDALQTRTFLVAGDDGWNQDLRFVGGGDVVAAVPQCTWDSSYGQSYDDGSPANTRESEPPCDERPIFAVYGNELPVVHDELSGTGAEFSDAFASGDGTLFVVADGRLWYSRGGPFALAYDFEGTFDFREGPLGSAMVAYQVDGERGLDQWQKGERSVVLQNEPGIFISVERDASFEANSIAFSARDALALVDPRGSDWVLFAPGPDLSYYRESAFVLAASRPGQVFLVRPNVGEVGSVKLPAGFETASGVAARFPDWQSDVPFDLANLWLFSDSDPMTVVRVENETLELRSFEGLPQGFFSVYEGQGGGYLVSSAAGVYRYDGSNVAFLGELFDTALPNYGGDRLIQTGADDDGTALVRWFSDSRVATYDVPDAEKGQSYYGVVDNGGTGWLLGPESDGFQSLYRVNDDGIELLQRIPTAQLIPAAGDWLLIPEQAGDLQLLAGGKLHTLRSGASQAEAPPIVEAPSEQTGYRVLFQYATASGLELSSYRQNTFTVLERGIDAGVTSFVHLNGSAWFRFDSGGVEHVARYLPESDELDSVYVGYDSVQSFGRVAELRGDAAGPTGLSMCPLRSRDGSCETAPEPNLTVDFADARGAFAAFVQSDEGVQLWRSLDR